jgi:sulfur carrier protein ThiS adenylyltransferase
MLAQGDEALDTLLEPASATPWRWDIPNDETSRITVKVNQRPMEVSGGTWLHALRDLVNRDADIVIRNGFPAGGDGPLEDGDEVVFIERGRVPDAGEMEAQMAARHGPGILQSVKGARVGIAGCGGLGSAVAVSLTRLGVGHLLLVDFDVVEPSNLNRQQYFVDQIGLPKVEALRDNLVRMNPFVTVETREMRLTADTLVDVFRGCTVLAECFDDPVMKREMTVAVRRDLPGTPLVTVSGIAGHGPSQDIGVRRVLEDVYLVGDSVSAAGPGQGLLAPRVAVAAGHQANLILRLLLGEDPCGNGED